MIFILMAPQIFQRYKKFRVNAYDCLKNRFPVTLGGSTFNKQTEITFIKADSSNSIFIAGITKESELLSSNAIYSKSSSAFVAKNNGSYYVWFKSLPFGN